MTIKVYKDCSYAKIKTSSTIKVNGYSTTRTKYYIGDKLLSITFTDAISDDVYCDIYYELLINEKQWTGNMTEFPFLNAYNTYTFNNMKVFESTRNITVWYPVDRDNFTNEYSFLTN